MSNKMDLIIILAVLGIAVFILWKSGIFKVANTASNIAESAGNLADKVISGADQIAETTLSGVNYAVGTVVNLPENIVQLGTMLPDLADAVGWQLGINTYDIAEPTERAKNIVDSLRALYPNCANDIERIKLQKQDGITFDAMGFPVDRYGIPIKL